MKKVISIFSVVIISAFLISCGETTQEKTDSPSVQAPSGDMVISSINEQVKDFSIDGFPGGSAKLKNNEDLENMERIIGLVKPIIEKLPDGYVMVIRGHAAAYPTKALQRSVSKKRAYKVYSALRKAGVPKSKIAHRGLAISEPLADYDVKDAKQRRVSFRAEKK